MRKYFLALLFVTAAHANVDDIDITPMLQPYAASNPVKPLPAVIEPIQYDLPESKWDKPKFYQAAEKCKTPMNLFERCKSERLLKYEAMRDKFKALATAKRKSVEERKKLKALENEYRDRPKTH